MEKRAYKSLRLKLKTFVDLSDERIKLAKGPHEKGAIGKVLELNSKIDHEEAKQFPDFNRIYRDLHDAIQIIDNLDTYASLDSSRR